MVKKRCENIDIEEFANKNNANSLYSSSIYSGGCYGPD